GPRLNGHAAVLHHGGPQHDAGIHLAVRAEIPDAAAIGPALVLFEIVDDFHGPHLRRAGYRTGRKARHQSLEGVMPGIESALDIRHDVHDLAVIFQGERIRHLHRSETRHAAHIVAA